jgi:GTPase SAR1 family protein
MGPLRRAIILAACLVLAVISLLVWFDGHSLDALNDVWGVTAGVIALISALVAWASSKSREAQRPNDPKGILEELADAVGAQWREEAEIRGLFNPYALPVTWTIPRTSRHDDLISPPSIELPTASLGSIALPAASLGSIADAFAGLTQRRLLVLGAAGTGKTVLLLRFVLEFLERRQPGQPVPILFQVGSWNPQIEHLHTWMAAWLEKTYPSLASQPPVSGVPLSLWLVRTRKILPLLDGLDEMAEELRPAALRALNRLAAGVPTSETDPLILTCRTAEYTRLLKSVSPGGQNGEAVLARESLGRAAVVELSPLKVSEIVKYLTQTTPHCTVDKWVPVTERLSQEPRGPLAEALSTPLMAAMARIAFSETDQNPVELLSERLTDCQSIQRFLLDQFIPSVYLDLPSAVLNMHWPADKAIRYYRYIANYLLRQRRSDLSWWELWRLIPVKLYWLIFGVSMGLISGIAFDILAGPGMAIFVGGVTAIVLPPAVQVVGVAPPSNVNVRLRTGVPRFLIGLFIGLAVGIVLEILLGLPFLVSVATGSLVGLFGGIAAGVEFLLEQPLDTTKAADPYSLLASDRTAFFGRILGVAPAGGCALGLAIGLESGLGLSRGARVGIVVALALALGISVVVSLRTTLTVGITTGVIIGALGGLVTGTAVGRGHSSETMAAVACGLWLWAEIGLGLAFTSAWGSYLIGRLGAAVRGHLPWRLMTFLVEGHQRGVLRKNGPVYEFRHVALQERLAEEAASQKSPHVSHLTPSLRHTYSRLSSYFRSKYTS